MKQPTHYSDIKTGRSSLENWLNKNYPEFFQYLKTNYVDIDIKTALYMFYNNIKTIPLCSCGNPVKFHGYQYGFSKFCCPTCAGNDKDVQEKLKTTRNIKYGENYPNIITKKCKATKLQRYGDENYNNIKKIKQTCLDRYGTDNPMKNNQVKEKSKQTCLERYGTECAMKSSIIKNKTKQTCLERYGVEWNWTKKVEKKGGVFTKHVNATWDKSGSSGVPVEWDIQYYNPETGETTT